MILGLTLILACQLLGEIVAVSTGLPVPGPVVGMALLLAGLALRDRARPRDVSGDGAPVERTAKGLLAHLSLLFVPAGVGVLQRLDVVAAHGAALAAALVLSTLLALVATAGTFLLASRLTDARGSRPEGEA